MDGDVDANSLIARSKPNQYFVCYVRKIENLLTLEKEKKEKMKEVFVMSIVLAGVWSLLCIGAAGVLHLGTAAGVLSVIGACGVGGSWFVIKKFIFKDEVK